MIDKIKLIYFILKKAIEGIDLSEEEGIILLTQTEKLLVDAVIKTANKLRERQVGDTVTYVINCNINFTNICKQHCTFCAFRRDEEQKGAFWLKIDQILEKAAYAAQKQATEICMQGGLYPKAKLNKTSLDYYLELVKTLKREFPQLHLHAFSPQEVQFIAQEDEISYSDVIIALRDAGLGSMPGTAAEVLDDDLRHIICPEKISTRTWLEIMSMAHSLGVSTTSTMLSGHLETPQQQIRHLIHLRNLQKTAVEKSYPARITEFILLPFVGKKVPQSLRKKVGRDQPDLDNNLLLTAVARIMLGNWISNHQPSWVKLGLNGALKALQCGCNDIGGTLMEENISTMAGAKGGTYMKVETLQKAIRSIHRPYRQRNTIYSGFPF